MTDYNKTSCRARGRMLMATRVCEYCCKPINWKCSSCHYIDDSVHVHASDNRDACMFEAVSA